MSRKPDRSTAMIQIIEQVKDEFPLYDADTFKCGPDNSCIGCPKKLMEMVETEVSYWEFAIQRGEVPTFDEINRFGKMCKNIKRGLVRNNIMAA
ncbi:hypothetical protein ACFFLZ_02265 [Photobacterium aphoticum]|uniref:Uncharacterized protein n=2 Tax=Photobacterium aphoticum TaxID=754436 RepID=A0A0J1GTM4_9GAMM|nr:hypothetical protein [Photobacterium aphoticum]KLV03016.1 hypothetical protein ABT58_00315 [Photobacterium aphoticum]PSU57866.1 hypothetical protein C9I90_08315 [Photobacterium aphoticum]